MINVVEALPIKAQVRLLLTFSFLYFVLLPSSLAKKFSNNGNEIAWGTIGNASTSEGLFFEAINTAGVLQIPIVMSVWDDGYGISVDNKQQTTKESISKALSGFAREDDMGIEILNVKGWDYSALIKTYTYASKIAREKHIPVLVHVTELTQPLGPVSYTHLTLPTILLV